MRALVDVENALAVVADELTMCQQFNGDCGQLEAVWNTLRWVLARADWDETLGEYLTPEASSS